MHERSNPTPQWLAGAPEIAELCAALCPAPSYRQEYRYLVTERDWQRVAPDAICDVLDRRLGVRASGDLGAAAGAPIAGSILSAPPDLAVAGDPLSILPSWRSRGG